MEYEIRCPSNIVQNNPQLFSYGAIENNDFLEEILSGKTTHVTTMIHYQENVQTVWNNIDKTTKQSVKNIPVDNLFCALLDIFSVTNSKPTFLLTYKVMMF